MCGLCGIVNKSGDAVNRELLQKMSQTMHHRGPDDSGYQMLGATGLGFQRLSIIDLGGSHQPMCNEDETLWIVFNGEIYNFQSLRERLEASGNHRFKTTGDTEVILHLYEDFGEQCVQKLRGMFAFAIWDTRRKTLFMARDRFGKKPLVYADLPGHFLFASELKALLQHPGVSKDIDYTAMDLYLTYQYVPSPRTIFKSIRKLPPAHTLTLKDGKVEVRRYWDPQYSPKTPLSFEHAQHQMMATLRESTKLRMIADVPLGAFLSGGKDSSVIVGLMSELSSKPVKTFSIGFEEEEYSELPYARMVAQRFQTDHQEFIVKPDATEVLPKLAWHYGEPFADSSALPSYYVSQMTRRHVTVALNGDGGDETLAGYPRYQAMRFIRYWGKLPLPLRQAISRSVSVLPDGHPPASKSWRIKRLLSLGLMDRRYAYVDTLSFFRESQKAMLYSSFLKEQVQTLEAPEYLAGVLDRADKLRDIDPYLYADMLTYLPECLMVKMDIAAMANSLEARSPFLDHHFVELVASFPPEWKLKGLLETKHILNVAIKNWLPAPILNRGKQGFAVPLSRWLRGSLKDYLARLILSEKALSRGLFEKSAVERLLQEHVKGTKNHGYQLWALMMLEHWFQAYID